MIIFILGRRDERISRGKKPSNKVLGCRETVRTMGGTDLIKLTAKDTIGKCQHGNGRELEGEILPWKESTNSKMC